MVAQITGVITLSGMSAVNFTCWCLRYFFTSIRMVLNRFYSEVSYVSGLLCLYLLASALVDPSKLDPENSSEIPGDWKLSHGRILKNSLFAYFSIGI